MYIIGIGDQTHDPSVCIAKDGQIVAAIEVERISRIKHNLEVNTNLYEIDTMGGYFEKLCQTLTREQREKIYSQCIDYCLQAAGNIQREQIKTIATSTLFDNATFSEGATIINHHLAHAASTFYASSFIDAAVLTLDGYGNGANGVYEIGSWAVGENNQLNIIKKFYGTFSLTEKEKATGVKNTLITLTNSLGAFYKNITVLVGMGHFGEGKTMGLSAYGEDNPIFYGIREHIKLISNGEFLINNREIYLLCKNILQQSRLELSPEKYFKFCADLAYVAQEISEEIVIHCCKALYQETKQKTLCLAGGIALNSSINGKIIERTPFEKIFIQPAAGDNGIALGCAYYASYMLYNLQRNNTTIISFSPYLGKDYIGEDGQTTIEQYPSHFKLISKEATTLAYIAELIAEGKIIGWFNGRCEIGPRALGNRSILADPRDVKLKDYLNLEVKKREWFRPFAPVILEEVVQDYFETNIPLPYMLQIVKIKEEVKQLIPAVAHFDGTSRVQTVNREQNNTLYQLIKAFEKITHIPLLLNTSFNGQGMPIVETPDDAMRCAVDLGLDAVFLNGTLLVRKEIT